LGKGKDWQRKGKKKGSGKDEKGEKREIKGEGSEGEIEGFVKLGEDCVLVLGKDRRPSMRGPVFLHVLSGNPKSQLPARKGPWLRSNSLTTLA